jgi:hypothetical protein
LDDAHIPWHTCGSLTFCKSRPGSAPSQYLLVMMSDRHSASFEHCIVVAKSPVRVNMAAHVLYAIDRRCKVVTLESMGLMHGHAARVTAVSSEESHRVLNAKTHKFPIPPYSTGRFREGCPGSATSGRAKRSQRGNNYTLMDKALTTCC